MLPLTDAADQLFAALEANQPLTLTGDASQGSGVEVTGEATEPRRRRGRRPDGATPRAGASPAARRSACRPPRSEIAGTTAAQVTCTRPEQ